MRHELLLSLSFSLAALLTIVIGASMANAQQDRADFLQRQIEKVEQQVGVMDRAYQASLLNIEHRLTKLESLAESTQTLLRTILAALVALIGQSVAGWLRIVMRARRA